MPKKLTKEIFIERAEIVHEKTYDYSKVDYINCDIKVEILCKKQGHGYFQQTPYSHLSGRGCPKCAGNLKLTTEEFIKKAKSIHGDLYDYDDVDYINCDTKVLITCTKEWHGGFLQTPYNHLQGNGCPTCGGKEQSYTEEFIEKAKSIHGDLYNYTLVDYINNRSKIKIICRKKGHGVFEQTPSDHLSGYGCRLCGNKKSSDFRTTTTEEFIEKAKSIHGDLYNYTLVDYINSQTKIKIVCRKERHGEFEQIPSDHLNDHGCPKCAEKYSPTTEEFIKKAIEIHGTKYDYSLVKYNNNHTKIVIMCPDHGEFEQNPNSHLQGNGCQKCSSTVSLPEIIWLNINHIKPEFRQYKILNYTVDGYDPNTNTVYEFHGDYWHGNPTKFKQTDINKVAHKTFGELYNQTINREQEIKTAGYSLVVIWESDFKEQYKEQIKNYKSIHGVQKIVECCWYD